MVAVNPFEQIRLGDLPIMSDNRGVQGIARACESSLSKVRGRRKVNPRPVTHGLRRLGWRYGLNLIVSDAAAEMLPARSLYFTYTVLVPAPSLSSHALLVE
jgi:hypothetical protein